MENEIDVTKRAAEIAREIDDADLASEAADFLRGTRCYREAPRGTNVGLTRPHPSLGFVTIFRCAERPDDPHGWGPGEHLVSYGSELEARAVCLVLGWEIEEPEDEGDPQAGHGDDPWDVADQ